MTDGDAGGSGGDIRGPDRIRSIAVHREDVASALEATLRSDREVVLRVTPPFSGRMRARLHAVDADAPGPDADVSDSDSAAGETDDSPAPIHVDPRDLVSDVPAYPEVDETAAAHPDADVETRRELHGEAVEAWRERVRESVVESVAIDIAAGSDDRSEATREVDVTALG